MWNLCKNFSYVLRSLRVSNGAHCRFSFIVKIIIYNFFCEQFSYKMRWGGKFEFVLEWLAIPVFNFQVLKSYLNNQKAPILHEKRVLVVLKWYFDSFCGKICSGKHISVFFYCSYTKAHDSWISFYFFLLFILFFFTIFCIISFSQAIYLHTHSGLWGQSTFSYLFSLPRTHTQWKIPLPWSGIEEKYLKSTQNTTLNDSTCAYRISPCTTQ